MRFHKAFLAGEPREVQHVPWKELTVSPIDRQASITGEYISSYRDVVTRQKLRTEGCLWDKGWLTHVLSNKGLRPQTYYQDSYLGQGYKRSSVSKLLYPRGNMKITLRAPNSIFLKLVWDHKTWSSEGEKIELEVWNEIRINTTCFSLT